MEEGGIPVREWIEPCALHKKYIMENKKGALKVLIF